eukprot:CAMPEP_0197695340 /NCGR_PEP_ID=MMETSP1338-20131121/115074_1 /TAXON_ID=43686 ORGANISM="Pelagodinium beii, Strain RCC1491" /NCGR_SAMPLE_ID=MMETSP1338 /ASSEMBLY_ACC=CAM_ASM_000754 /LENGTH=64 /DNA_ID=CAMNT_0043278311 /DNA_START=162 /DNA_END=356 /DNA_ORIENTATION=+
MDLGLKALLQLLALVLAGLMRLSLTPTAAVEPWLRSSDQGSANSDEQLGKQHGASCTFGSVYAA